MSLTIRLPNGTLTFNDYDEDALRGRQPSPDTVLMLTLRATQDACNAALGVKRRRGCCDVAAMQRLLLGLDWNLETAEANLRCLAHDVLRPEERAELHRDLCALRRRRDLAAV